MSEILSINTLSLAETNSGSLNNNSRHIPKDPTTILYGAADKNLEGHKSDPFYLTTAIAYTNGYPHMGHAYEFLTADILVRYHRILGYDTYFLTGSDEHGQKVAAAADKAGLSPKSHCDIYVDAFKALNQRLGVSYSDYIRTTDDVHIDMAQKLWKLCSEAGDIYLDRYEGWYNEREENFVTENEAKETDFKDPGSGIPLKKVTEESYFFRMSKYAESLITHIESNPSFIQPEQFRNNILVRLKKEGLRDLSISRTSFKWGIPMPDGFDSKHVMYVWFDALSNYTSGIRFFDDTSPLRKYWPAQRHIIGKDIIWFHCVIWPCILMSAKIPLPMSVFSHGFVNAADGRKMSKSYNNAVDPHDILDKYACDTIRYYFSITTSYGADINFSEASMITMHNSELADVLGNLVHRALTLGFKYCNGVIPDTKHDTAFSLPFNLSELIREISLDMETCAIHASIGRTMEAVRSTNRFLTEAEPWKMKGENESRRAAVVRTTLEAIYAFSHFLAPIIPYAAQSIFSMLNTPPVPTIKLNLDMYNLVPGTSLSPAEILFKKIENETGTATTTGADASAVNSVNDTKKNKAKSNQAKEPEREYDPNQPHFTKIELKVGKIVKVWNHETADRLFCEEIDIGEATPRPIASGLREFYTLDEMLNRYVVVVCNLKEAKMKGFESYGMVLAAKSSDGKKVELISPPAGAAVGEKLVIKGLTNDPWPASKVKKMKVWEAMAEDLKTDDNCNLCWKGQIITSEIGDKEFTSHSIASSQVG